MRTQAGPGFQPLCRSIERSGEWSFIYARPATDARTASS